MEPNKKKKVRKKVKVPKKIEEVLRVMPDGRILDRTRFDDIEEKVNEIIEFLEIHFTP